MDIPANFTFSPKRSVIPDHPNSLMQGGACLAPFPHVFTPAPGDDHAEE
jgi:hypothetical protein